MKSERNIAPHLHKNRQISRRVYKIILIYKRIIIRLLTHLICLNFFGNCYKIGEIWMDFFKECNVMCTLK